MDRSTEKHNVTLDGVDVEVTFNARALVDCDLQSADTKVVAASLDDVADEILSLRDGERFDLTVLGARVFGRVKTYEDTISVFVDRVIEAPVAA